MLEKHLEDLGLNQKEIVIYLALAELGKSTAQAVAKKAGLPRTSAYGFLDSLLELGLIQREQARDTTYYQVNDPQSFLRLLDREKAKLAEKEKSISEIMTVIDTYIEGREFSIPKLQFFEGRDRIETMLYQYLPLWRRSYKKIGDYTMWGYQDHTFVDEYQKWHKHAWESRDGNEIIKLFSTKEGVAQQSKDALVNREIRLLPEDIEFPCSIWIHGEYVLFGITRSQPHYLVLMHDTVFSAALRAMFQMLWRAVK